MVSVPASFRPNKFLHYFEILPIEGCTLVYKLLGPLLQHPSQISHLCVSDSYTGFAFSVIETLCSELLCIAVHIRLICMKRN